ncbi:hypothetical protein [Motiliproteus sediminis]|uniref:hypothetical protein n=1 Tax=Motiliproteus sediminis TaxID=1468178 RepID=UPI001AEF6BD6|nr:hypothetical protein [Motiliproteus sediminis]
MIEGLERLLAKGTDSPELRFGLGKAYLERQEAERAVAHLRACVTHKQGYSAAWKLLGKAYQAQGDAVAAADAWRQGIAAAQQGGDKQAEKEMQVFLRRLEKIREG